MQDLTRVSTYLDGDTHLDRQPMQLLHNRRDIKELEEN